MANHDSFLRSALAANQYRDIEKTRRDANEVLQHYRGLKPVAETFVFNNGISKKLVALSGTIPVQYKGSLYNIPVYLWLLDTHPHNAPLVYVKPTPDMRIKVSRHVDHNGKVYLPYLHDWKHGESDLMALIQVLIFTFQEQPPVYAVPTSPPSINMMMSQPSSVPYPTSSYSTPYPPYPAMPLPPGGLSSPPSMMSPPPSNPIGNNSNMTMPFSVRPSLLTAAEEKLRRRLEGVCLATEIEKQTGDQLTEGSSKLKMMERRLQEEHVALHRDIEMCQNEVTNLDEKISKHQDGDQQAIIDDAILPPTPLYKQIVNTFAEEAALEDSIYYLGEGLRTGKVDLEQFQKHIRVLARKQFMLRALLQKCRQKAGLAG